MKWLGLIGLAIWLDAMGVTDLWIYLAAGAAFAVLLGIIKAIKKEKKQ